MRFPLSTTLELKPSGRSRLLLALTAFFMVISRVLTLPDNLPGQAATAFAEALRRFDPVSGFPPLPGSPVYVFCARVFAFFGCPDPLALALPGIVSAALAVFPLYHLVKRLHGRQDATLAVALYALNPGVWLISLSPGPHALMLFPFLFSLRLLLRLVLLPPALVHHTRFISLYAGTVTLGLLAGISMDAALLLLPLLITAGYGLYKLKRKKILLEMFNGILLGTMLWLIPFLYSVSLSDLILGSDIPAAAAASTPALSDRFACFIWNLTGFGFLNSPIPGIAILPALLIILALTLAVLHIRFRFRYFFLLSFFALYGLFTVLVRDSRDPRTIVLFLPMLMVFIAAGLSTQPYRRFLALAIPLTLFSGFFAFQRALDYKRAVTAEQAVADYVFHGIEPDAAVLFGGASATFTRYGYPARRAHAVRSIAELDKPGFRKARTGRPAFITSEIPGAAGAAAGIAARFPPQPYLFGRADTLVLYRLPLLPALEK